MKNMKKKEDEKSGEEERCILCGERSLFTLPAFVPRSSSSSSSGDTQIKRERKHQKPIPLTAAATTTSRCGAPPVLTRAARARATAPAGPRHAHWLAGARAPT